MIAKKPLILLGLLAVLVLVYLLNASWLAPRPAGRATLLAQRGLHQRYDLDENNDSTCTAQHIYPPSHTHIDNTLPSIGAALAAGADIVEVDARVTREHDFVLFHDVSLECRTNGRGLLSEHSVEELKRLDVGYGYTADAGRSFPLRGKGVGLMPTLEEALRAHPDLRFLIQLKDGDPATGDQMVRYLKERGHADWHRLAFFGARGPLARLDALAPGVRTWSGKQAGRCLVGYLMLGWATYVPRDCDRGTIIVPVTQASFLWGWPDRFLARMRKHHAEVIVIGRIRGLSGSDFSRLDTIEELRSLPPGFDGTVWTDRIEVIGPVARPRLGAGGTT